MFGKILFMLFFACANLSAMIREIKDLPSVEELLKNDVLPLTIELACNIKNYLKKPEVIKKNEFLAHPLLQSMWLSKHGFVSSLEKALQEKKAIHEFESIIKNNVHYNRANPLAQKFILASLKQAYVDCSSLITIADKD